jgi:hypothetical protein
MVKSELIPLLIGIDLEKYNENGVISTTGRKRPYLALGMAIKQNKEALSQYPNGFPHRDLFLKGLKAWKWVNRDTYDILIKDSNIELNISEYFKGGEVFITNPVHNALRLVRELPHASTEGDITKRHTILAISYGDEDPTKTILFCYGDKKDDVFVLFKLRGNNKRFQFIST